MSQIIIKNSKIHFFNQSFHLDDLYTLDFFEYCNQNIDQFKNNSFYVNELFLNTIQPLLALKYLIISNNIKKIKLDNPDSSLQIISKILSNEGLIQLENNRLDFLVLKQKVRNLINYNISYIYISYYVLRIPRIKQLLKINNTEIILIRTDAAKKKFQHFNQPKIFEDIKVNSSIYSQSSRINRLVWLVKIYFLGIKELHEIKNLTNKEIGRNSFFIAGDFYPKRIVHTLLYYEVLDDFFSKNVKIKTLFTGNNLDRYSVIEEVLSKKHEIKVICVPHGLEYGFKFPKGFSGDIFYTTTNKASIHFNHLYKSNKFIFDNELIKQIFTLQKTNENVSKKVVFFTESREIEVNIQIIKLILPLLESEKIELYLKIHPKDDVKNYSKFNLTFIENMNDALVNSICFARKSTVLLECLYNNSKAASILINQKDKAIFSTFPSLATDEIFVSENINDLANWIINNYKNHE